MLFKPWQGEVVEIFSDAGPVEHFKKLEKEAREAAEDHTDIFEYADCLLCLYAATYKGGFSLDELLKAAKEKFEVVKTREWLKLPDGTYQHKTSAPSPTPEQGEKGVIVKVLGLDDPFPLRLVLQFLSRAAQILLHKKDYDGPDYEEMERCVTRANEIVLLIDNYQSYTAAQPPPPLPALTTDEEAAEKYVSIEWYPDYVAKGEAEQSKQSRKDFLAGCTHVRSQQQEDSHEKEIMMQAFNNVREIFERRAWIMEGRGSYRYDDDHYKEEVRYLYEEFDTIQKDTWKNIKSKSFEYRKKIIEEYLKSQQPVDAVALLEWMREEGYELRFVNDLDGNKWAIPGKPWVTSIELLALFSGSQASNQSEERDWKAAGLRIMNELYMKHRFFLRDLDVSNEDKRLFLTELGISSEFIEQH